MDPSLNMVSIPVEFYLLAVGALDNRLAMNLLWETVRYLRFPYLTNGMETLTGRKELAGFSREETIEALRAEAAHSYGRSLQALFAFMDEMSLDPGLKDAAPIPFHWNIYRQRPQLRYSFASLLIREILKGTYPQGTYLPSLPQLVDRYGIPLMTVRRTLGLLEELGMTRSYHGKGTLVCMEPADIDLSRSSIREGIRLYVESLQLLHLTVQNIFLCTWESADPAKRAALIRHFLFLQSEEKSYLCFEACLTFIEDHCPPFHGAGVLWQHQGPDGMEISTDIITVKKPQPTCRVQGLCIPAYKLSPGGKTGNVFFRTEASLGTGGTAGPRLLVLIQYIFIF